MTKLDKLLAQIRAATFAARHRPRAKPATRKRRRRVASAHGLTKRPQLAGGRTKRRKGRGR